MPDSSHQNNNNNNDNDDVDKMHGMLKLILKNEMSINHANLVLEQDIDHTKIIVISF